MARFKLIRTLLGFRSINASRFALVVVLAVGFAIAQGASIGLLLPAAKFVEDSSNPEVSGSLGAVINWVLSAMGLSYSMFVVFAALLVMVIVAQVLNYGHHYLAIRTSQEFGADLRDGAYRSFVHAEMPFHYINTSGKLTNAVNVQANRSVAAFLAMQNLAIRAVVILLYGVVLVLISWETTLIAMVAIIIVSLITQLWLSGSRRTGQNVSGLYEKLQTRATESLQGVREVKLFNREASESDLLKNVTDNLAMANAKLGYRATQIQLVVEPTILATGIVILYVGSTMLGLSLAELAVFVYALMRITPEARALNNARYNIAGHIGSMVDLLQLIKTAKQESEQGEDGQEPLTDLKRPFKGLFESITFEDLSFGYDPFGPYVFTEVNLSLRAGQTTAILGPSGAGKSTILALLVRLIRSTKGRILLDGTPIEEFELASLRRQIGLVSQDSAIFNDTVLNNIKYGYPAATMEDVEQVARLANAHDFIQELAQGYDTVVGDRGITLSVGQRQRLALARALLLNPSVLLLDEVTSAQDPASERVLQEAIWNASTDRTVVIVTHRLSSIQGVDRVLVLQNGTFVEDGPPEELLRSNGIFRHYYDIQIGSGWGESQAEAT